MTHPFDHSREADSADPTEPDQDVPLETTELSAKVYQIPAKRTEMATPPQRDPWFDDVNVLRGISLAAKAGIAFSIVKIIESIWRSRGR